MEDLLKANEKLKAAKGQQREDKGRQSDESTAGMRSAPKLRGHLRSNTRDDAPSMRSHRSYAHSPLACVQILTNRRRPA
ncbi:hypothetical protein EYF80_020038 [Liparis tanakae]|uniref:Uncharacterized protein n=1 Tax=Liparis tanakae TaxID=230148 RepID=A0A4Z2HXB7_9TELE|nr:hypothetical protein EYF80_020038 [Liparis tanakae]